MSALPHSCRFLSMSVPKGLRDLSFPLLEVALGLISLIQAVMVS